MKNLKIGKKLLVTFGIIVAMLCVTAVVAISSLIEVRDNFTLFYEKPYTVNNYAMDMTRALESSSKYFGYATMTDDLQETAQYIQSAEDALAAMKEGSAFMMENFLGDKSLVEKMDAAMTSLREDRLQAYELANQNKNDEAIKLFFEKVHPGLLEAQEYLMQISDFTRTTAQNSYTSADSVASMATLLLITVVILALVLTIILALYLTKSLTRPIKEIETAANQMAEGQLNVQVEYTSRDELGNLSNSIRKLIANLQSIMGDVDYVLGEMAQGNFAIRSKNPDGYVGDFTAILLSMRMLRDRLNSTLSQINMSADQVSSGSDQVSSGA